MSIYPEDITKEEKEAGFEICEFKTGYGDVFGGAEVQRAVVKYDRHGDAIFKISKDRYQYKFVLAGKDEEEFDSWHPTEDRTYSLEEIKGA